MSERDRWRGISRRAADAALAYGGRDKTLADVVALLDAGAYPNERDWYGWTPLHHVAGLQLATEVDEIPDIIRALVKAGANPNARLDRTGRGTPLHVAALMSEIPEITRALLGAGSDPNAREDDGRTPLHHAARRSNGTAGVVSALLEAGSDPNAQDDNGRTPLHSAAMRSGRNPGIPVLADAGADPNARDNPDVIEALLDAGADPNARNEAGRRPFEVVPQDAPLRGRAAFRRLKNAGSEGP